MNKTLKIAMIIAMMIAVIFTFSGITFAANAANAANAAKDANAATGGATAVIGGIHPGVEKAGDYSGLQNMAASVISLIQVASVILAVILIAVFGFKFIMGSANEKADYQKSFIPLIVGLVVVFAATSIAKLIMTVANSANA